MLFKHLNTLCLAPVEHIKLNWMECNEGDKQEKTKNKGVDG